MKTQIHAENGCSSKVCKIEGVLGPHLYIDVCVHECIGVHVCECVCAPYGSTICPVPVCNPRPAWQRTQVFLLFPPDPEGSTVTELSQHEVIQGISAGTQTKYYQQEQLI